MMNAHKQVSFYQVENSEGNLETASVIRESPVSLTVNGEIWLSFMCTPIDLEAMAVGFLFNEDLIQSRSDIADVRLCPTQDNIDVWTNVTLKKPDQWRRTSGCTGGYTSVNKSINKNQPTENKNGGILSAHQIYELIEELFKSQELYRQSGGVHTSTLTDGSGLFVTAEDIGRHNTLDKIAGRCLLENIQLKRRILLTTGRVSSEMLQKSARLRAAIVVSRTSPSSLSIELAEEFGITLIGYARRNRFNVYTHPQRIVLTNSAAAKPLDKSKKLVRDK